MVNHGVQKQLLMMRRNVRARDGWYLIITYALSAAHITWTHGGSAGLFSQMQMIFTFDALHGDHGWEETRAHSRSV